MPRKYVCLLSVGHFVARCCLPRRCCAGWWSPGTLLSPAPGVQRCPAALCSPGCPLPRSMVAPSPVAARTAVPAPLRPCSQGHGFEQPPASRDTDPAKLQAAVWPAGCKGPLPSFKHQIQPSAASSAPVLSPPTSARPCLGLSQFTVFILDGPPE